MPQPIAAQQPRLPAGAGAAVSLRATLVRPLFSSPGDENGRRPFSVWAVAVGEGGALQELRAVAELEAAAWGSEGDEVVLTGKWVDHPRHGRQFRAESVRPAVPRDARGLARWLARQEGIGPATASKVVAELGAGALERVLEDPSCLDALGLARPQREAVLAAARAFRENREREEVLVFCHQHGLGPAQADRVWRELGKDAPEILRGDPWRLAYVEGFGFLTADAVARSLGVHPASPARLRAALYYALYSATWDEGHVFLPRGELIERAFAILREIALRPPHYGRGFGSECRDGLPAALAALAAPEADAEGRVRPPRIRLILDPQGGGGEPRAYLPKLLAAEREVGKWLAERRRGAGLLPPGEAAELAARANAVCFGGGLDAMQEAAAAAALSLPACALTGGPGTGKTTVVKAVVRAYGMACERAGRPFRVALAAPTGRAAKRLAEVVGIEAKTIHRMLGYNPLADEFAVVEVPADLLVVDESSMVDLPLMAELVRRLPPRCSVLLVGDADQLPPVGPGCPFHQIAREGLLPVSRLSRIYRQGEGSAIAAAAAEVNAGRAPRLSGGECSRREYPRPPRGLPEPRREAMARETRERMARDAVEAVRRLLGEGWAPDDIQVLVPIRRGPCGAQALNELLRPILNPDGRSRGAFRTPGGREFWVGDRVMHLVNDYAKGIFNGEIGKVVAVNVPVSIPVRGQRGVSWRASTGFLVRYESGDGAVDIPYDAQDAGQVALAYCATVHKSQGCEFPAVVLVVGWDSYMLLRRPMVYTALTRARERLVVLAEEGALERAAATEDDSVRLQDLEGAAARAAAPD